MCAVRVTRLLVDNYRGWQYLDLRPRGHVLLAGVPRAGRSDVIAALVCVLDVASARNPEIADFRQWVGVPPVGGQGTMTDTAEGAQLPQAELLMRAAVAEVEVTLSDLDAEIQQLFEGFLEPLEPLTGCASTQDVAAADAPLCVRLTYRLTFDQVTEVLEAVVYFPARSDPAAGQFVRVPAATRRALPVLTLRPGQPLQLRGGGTLRRIVDSRDVDAATLAFQQLQSAIAGGVTALSAEPAIAEAVEAVLGVGGVGGRLGDSAVTAADVRFLAEDGSVSALLRRLQPAVQLDGAGPLPLGSHGSTASGVLSAAEAMLLGSVPGAVILADDFGDQLDTAATEHLAGLLRAMSGQVWLSTRRPEAARAFEPTELVRLVRHVGTRSHHQLLMPKDRKALTALRQLHTQLLAALTAPVVAITEGPHDVAVYSLVNRRFPPPGPPLSAWGVRLVAAGTGGDGGIDQIPRIADLARQLGFRVLGVIDRDKASAVDALRLAKIEASCDVVIRLPPGAIESAILSGVALDKIAEASAVVTEYGVPDPMAISVDESTVTALCKVIHKQGLHEQVLDALYDSTGAHPPVISVALGFMTVAASPSYAGPKVMDLVEVPRPASATP